MDSVLGLDQSEFSPSTVVALVSASVLLIMLPTMTYFDRNGTTMINSCENVKPGSNVRITLYDRF